MELYWPDERIETGGHHRGFVLAARSKLALDLISHFGVIAGESRGEDRSGRARIELQSPATLVGRCFEIADLFVAEAERRGEIRAPTVALEDAFAFGGQMESIRTHENFASATRRRKDVA